MKRPTHHRQEDSSDEESRHAEPGYELEVGEETDLPGKDHDEGESHESHSEDEPLPSAEAGEDAADGHFREGKWPGIGGRWWNEVLIAVRRL